jgi:Putative prokaryotic signal transducing protein
MSSKADELARLAAVYAQMGDDELQRIARDAVSLTDIAQSLLAAELSRRHLEVPSSDRDSVKDRFDEIDADGPVPVTLRRFRDLPEALLAKGSLESAGIECHLMDDNMVRLDWFISNLLGGVKLQVWPQDIAEATEILNLPIPDTLDVEGSGLYQQPHCPNCNSMDVTFEELNKPVAYASAWVGLPLPVHRKAWKCHTCRVEWEDAGPDKTNIP